MKRIFLSAVIMLCSLASVAPGQNPSKVRVIGNRVNLRAKADANAEVVGQAGEGDILLAKSFQDAWVEVAAPEAVDVWVHKEFVADDRVMASTLRMRAGPGINYSPVGDLQRDDVVTRRGEFGEWLKIAPPAAVSLWVSRDYVEVLQSEKPRTPVVQPAVKPPEPRAPTPVVAEPAAEKPAEVTRATPAPVTSTESEPVPSDLKLIPLDGQGKLVQREGTLRLSGFVFGRPSRYRLVRQQANRIETICYVRGNSRQLNGFVGQDLLIRGREYWVKGVKDPVVIPDQIVPRAAR